MSDDKKRVHAARLLTEKGGRIWVLFDERHTLRGRPGESQKSLLRRWQQDHGKVEVLVRVNGVCRPSELAMQIADLQHPRESQEGNAERDAPQERTGMKPFRTRDGRVIVDQRCRCCHARSRHEHRLAQQPVHRPCLAEGCSCQNFSFRDFIYAEASDGLDA